MLTMAPDQPEVTGLYVDHGLFIKEHLVRRAGMALPQHSHSFAHVSGIVAGGVRLFKDGVLVGDFMAPSRVVIEAHAKHLFVTLAPDTVIWCIHASASGEEPDIYEDHQIVEAV